ncbi:hypothetical protein [Marinobacterium jannaschii]|uniref:hypothetical protein n=1 Tax=Marinobacterium jannaschii TaxID=64970 RepID=UPI0012EC3453|nr:hypothetical protein [Marinobacterium jannaschii]
MTFHLIRERVAERDVALNKNDHRRLIGSGKRSVDRYQVNQTTLTERAMKAGDIKIFTKSGNQVRLIERDGNGWVVERTRGKSTGKQMWCPDRALVDSLD